MTKLRVAVVTFAVIALVGCHGRESITGGYGDRVVVGQVAMAAGMSNSSPAGVRVVVGATGMSAVLDDRGAFTFFGVPEASDLHFTRGDDGVDAHLRLDESMAPLAIVLSATSASSGRRRAVPPSILKQYEGLVQKISSTEITLNGVTLKINADTVIRKGNQKLQASDIKVGDRVHVKANDATAVEIKLQNPDGDDKGDDQGGQTMTANGTVTAVSTSDLKVATEAHSVVTVKVDATTIIRKQGTQIKLADIKVGDEVNTMGTRIDDHTLLARQIEVRGVSGHK